MRGLPAVTRFSTISKLQRRYRVVFGYYRAALDEVEPLVHVAKRFVPSVNEDTFEVG